MHNKSKRLMAVSVAAILLVTSFAGCSSGSKNPKSSTSASTTKSSSEKDPWAGVSDSSDLPTWSGNQLKLRLWSPWGKGDPHREKKAANNVVSPEIKRVTGVEIDIEQSFDNNGEGAETKIARMLAARDFPDIILSAESTTIDRLIKAGVLHDLTDSIPKYAPNALKMIPQNDMYKSLWDSLSDQGKTYFLPYGLSDLWLREDPEKAKMLDSQKLKHYVSPSSENGYVWAREDILKKLYPNAKTADEIEELYVKRNGVFTEADVLDIPINSAEDYFKMLYEIKKLGIREGNREVFPGYTHEGGNSFNLLSWLSGMLYGYHMTPGSGNEITAYWDKETQRLEYMFKQPWFKDVLKKWNKAIRDDVCSKEALIDTSAVFKEKRDNGLYAVTFNSGRPDESVLKKAGKNYRYRKVYFNIAPNYKKFGHFSNPPDVSHRSMAVFKDSVKKEDLPQVLRYIDFLASEPGLKLSVWGPKSAGLFEEKNGKRVFKDKDLEENIVYGKRNGKGLEYGLADPGGSAFGVPALGSGNIYHPKFSYDLVISKNEGLGKFATFHFRPLKTTPIISQYLNGFAGDIPEVKKFYDTKAAFEFTEKKLFAAASDEEFEKIYKEYVELAERNGLTEETRKKAEEAYKEKNKDFMKFLK